jgi:hypothetical protein
MTVDSMEHPDAPGIEALAELVVEPVARAEIERRRDAGETLAEDPVRERGDLEEVYVNLNRQVRGHDREQDVGTYLYRYTQLFGAPQCPEYLAGEDVSWREDETFKYLLAVDAGDLDTDDLPAEWLMTVYDWRVSLGVSVAAWREEGGELTAERPVALASLQLAYNVGSEPVRCEYEDGWY